MVSNSEIFSDVLYAIDSIIIIKNMSSFIYFIFLSLIILMVYSNNIDPYYSFKCAVASFFANYAVGIFHPLELLKTRLQSTSSINQAMMGKQ